MDLKLEKSTPIIGIADAEKDGIIQRKIWVHGVVQGVGFRPFVYRLAHEHNLNGWVRNTSAGVEIELEGSPNALQAFLSDLRAQAPPLAHIESVEVADAVPTGYRGFEIRHSQARAGRYQLVSPDIATCADCLRELFDPRDRRYRYPFINCTNCGPRFTIIEDIPYDRAKTTMRDFVMCPDCQREYDDPLNRRFHAQPNACPVCGPALTLTDAQGEILPEQDVIAAAARLLLAGRIVAIKGLGGFHLACDATNVDAIQVLRRRKRRPHKPLAVMMATMEDIRAHCEVSETEAALLTSLQCPIVLLPWRQRSNVCDIVAPGNRYLGVMLPYTPLHHVLLRDVGHPLVMTSGNLSEEPIARDNEEASHRLGHLADNFVLHNRDIYARYDDSVWFVPSSGPQPIRRSRGYAPFPIRLPFELPQVLACGAELKNTFCVTKENYAFVSQHIGDMENLETLQHFERSVQLYLKLFRAVPQVVAHDMHPDYLATRYARELGEAEGKLRLVPVQHHYAHTVSCMADNGLAADHGPVIGVALDGTGYGTDGAIWGGEFLIADYHSWQRAGHLEYLPLVGGEAAIKNPYRSVIAYGYSLQGAVPDVPALQDIPAEEMHIVQRQVEQQINTPQTSSCGRFFDAVAALCGVRQRVTYEAQAAIELEMLSRDVAAAQEGKASYPFSIVEVDETKIIHVGDTWGAILTDLHAGQTAAAIGWRFHRTIAQMVTEMCQRLRAESDLWTVALSGGCFQNRLLLALTLPLLQAAGFEVLVHHQVPCNDGGLSLGQAVVAGLGFDKE